MKIGSQQTRPTFDEIREILKEVSLSQKETAQRMKAQMKETDRRMKETDHRRKYADQTMKKLESETKEEMKKLSQSLRKSEALFQGQWGKLVESLVEGKFVELLQSRGIDVSETSQRIEISYKTKQGDIQKREIDIIAANGREKVAVEVKTTLKPDDVKYFMKTLEELTCYVPRYKNSVVYGAVAYLRSESKASLFAERQGLFVIRATGDSASLTNKPDFKPKTF